MRAKRSTIKMILSKRKDIKTLTDLRFILALHKTGLKSVKGRPENMARIMNSGLSWQQRLEWATKINSFHGKKVESLEWLTVLYNDSALAQEMMHAKSKRVSGQNNPGFKHGGRLSPFSKKSSSYNPDLAKIVNDKLNATGNRSNRIEYYLLKGMGLCQAISALKERQATCRLDRFILRYGQEEGTKRWNERQEKWQNTLNSKSIEEKARINAAKISSGYTVSNAEKDLHSKLAHLGVSRQLALSYNEGKNYYVYDIVLGSKIIEYNGDIWHANPELYDESFVNPISKLTATNIWNKEAHKEAVANSHGYTILRVWESDYKKNKEKVIKECISFLTQ